MYACELWRAPGNLEPILNMERWAYRFATRLIRRENEKFFQNSVEEFRTDRKEKIID